jgi:glycosyltransferase involved in cell wall biosynthesis
MIVHMHGGEFMAGEGMPSWLKALVGLTLTGCHIIVLSQREQTILRRYVKTAKLFVLPNCVKVNEADCFDRSYAKDGPLTVLFLGRIALSKGIDVIYRAMVALGKMPGNIRFVMAGAGPDERVYVDKFRELLGPRFEYRGIVDGIAKTELLKECDVFLLPSLFEGMPMALLETMALGLVPIVTNVGSIASVVTDGKNGILLHTQSPEQVVDALSMLMADKAYLQVLSQHARQYILANCRPDAYFERLNALYEYD